MSVSVTMCVSDCVSDCRIPCVSVLIFSETKLGFDGNTKVGGYKTTFKVLCLLALLSNRQSVLVN